VTDTGSAEPVQAPISCPACGHDGARNLVTLESVPVFCNVPQATEELATNVDRADIRLVACEDCCHVYNENFDPKRVAYAVGYENPLDFSPRFRDYADALVRHLDETRSLAGATVIEFGCGDGAFLRRLHAYGAACVGFDPSYAGPDHASDPSDIRIVRSFDPADAGIASADLAVSRHVLEHLAEPLNIARKLTEIVRDTAGGRVYIEVPNGLATVRDLGIWDLIYEHVSYFWEGSLRRLLARAGLVPVEVSEDFGGQFLRTLAESGGAVGNAGPGRESVEPLLAAFADEFARKHAAWQQTLVGMSAAGKRAVVWGAGSKGVTFLNVFRHVAPVEFVVDLNPNKHGSFVAGSAQRIVAPERLVEYAPDAVIVMNPIYAGEIRENCERLGIDAEILTA
jgi:2-polyprenyl-3-methyl-5-hydroxy-6-metoxy-1,4-benzoquinol methylase